MRFDRLRTHVPFAPDQAVTLGITRAGNETAYLVNVDLAEYFKQNLGYWKDIQKKIDGGA